MGGSQGWTMGSMDLLEAVVMDMVVLPEAAMAALPAAAMDMVATAATDHHPEWTSAPTPATDQTTKTDDALTNPKTSGTRS